MPTKMMWTRWIISILGMYSCALMFMYRAGVSVAVVSMTHKHYDNHSILNDTLPANYSKSSITEHFDWNQNQQGIILSASFYLYWCLPTLVGTFTDRYGGQWFAFAGVLGPCLLSAIAPIAIEHYQEWALIIIQTLVGAFHGFTYPALFSIYSKWFSCKVERARANSFMQVGNAFGCAGIYLIAGTLCTLTSIRWHLVFYVMAGLHVPWLLLWLWFAASDPRSSKRISDIELDYIERLQNIDWTMGKQKNVSTPWLKILTSMVVWSSVICKTSCAFGFFLFLNKMPSYFAMVYDLDIAKNGQISAIVLAAYGVTSFGSPFLANQLVHRFHWQPLKTKKLMQCISMAGPALCLVLIPQFGKSNQTIVFMLMILFMFLHGFFTSGEWSIVAEYSRNFSGSIVGFVHTLAFLMGMFAPMMTGWIFQSPNIGHNTMQKWSIIFYITAAGYLIGDIVFLLFGTDQQQEWDKI